MNALDRAGFIAHSRNPDYLAKVADAESILAAFWAEADRPYVAWSGGKDSSAVLWHVLRLRPDHEVHMTTTDESRILHADLDEVIGWWRGRFPDMAFHETVYSEVSHQGLDYWAKQSHEHGGLYRQGDRGRGILLGCRSEESGARRRYIQRHVERTGVACGWYSGRYFGFPLAAWSVLDVGATLATHAIPVLRCYQGDLTRRMALRLRPGDARRGGINGGELAELRHRDPRAWQGFDADNPTLRRYT